MVRERHAGTAPGYRQDRSPLTGALPHAGHSRKLFRVCQIVWLQIRAEDVSAQCLPGLVTNFSNFWPQPSKALNLTVDRNEAACSSAIQKYARWEAPHLI